MTRTRLHRALIAAFLTLTLRSTAQAQPAWKSLLLSYADNWLRYPDLSGQPRLIGSDEWNNTQYGYQIWWLSHIPKAPGFSQHGYNNWWIYIANVDEDLPDRSIGAEVVYPKE